MRSTRAGTFTYQFLRIDAVPREHLFEPCTDSEETPLSWPWRAWMAWSLASSRAPVSDTSVAATARADRTMRPLSTAARENRMVTSAERLEQCATLDEAEEVSNDGAECKTTRTEESYTTNSGGTGPGRMRNELAKVVSDCPVIYSSNCVATVGRICSCRPIIKCHLRSTSPNTCCHPCPWPNKTSLQQLRRYQGDPISAICTYHS